MITEGEKKYLEHALELAEYIDQKSMTGNLKSEILDKMLVPYGLSDEKKIRSFIVQWQNTGKTYGQFSFQRAQ